MKKLSKNYRPSEKEKFMNPKMKEYFRLKLINWKKDLLKESSNTLNNLQKEDNVTRPDISDRATEEIERSFELRARERERKLITKIDEAIKRIENETIGMLSDVSPTILDLMKIKKPPEMTGQSLVNQLK